MTMQADSKTRTTFAYAVGLLSLVGDSLVAEKHSHAKYRFWDLTIPLQHKTDRGP